MHNPSRLLDQFCFRRGDRGVTLLELLITLLIVSILVALAAPSYLEWSSAARVRTQTHALLSALVKGRDTAMLHRHQVRICASSNGATCSGATNWAVGWLVKDLTNSTVLATEPAISGGNTLAASVGAITFASNGEPNVAALFELKPKVCSGKAARSISVELTGLTSDQAASC